MKTTLISITPKMAKKWLENLSNAQENSQFKQRNLSQRVVAKYAADMRAGHWKVTHQGIAIDADGLVLDGQHRIAAIAKSGCTVTMLVSHDTPKEIMDCTDSGFARGIAQQLQIAHGYTSAAQKAAIIRGIAICFTQDTHTPISTSQTLWFLEKLNFNEAISRLLCVYTGKRGAPWTAPWCIYWKNYPEKAESFARNLVFLEELPAGDPALMLHRYFSGAADRPRRDRLHLQRIAISALHIFHVGRKSPNDFLRPNLDSHRWLLNLDGGKMLKQVLDELGYTQ